nr:DNA-3-methyladenine glycosylase I [Micromonospora sp. DSM 115978]
AVVPASAALAKALKKAGFVHVGPTTMYALMQACGLVDDHLADCFARRPETSAAG